MTTEVASPLRSGELARAAGVNQQTLRYYERRGILAEPARSPGGHRLYARDVVVVLQVIKAAQRLGFSLDEVAELVDRGRHRHGRADAGLQRRAAAKLAEVEARIEDLGVVRDTLASALAAGCDDLLACAGTACCPLPLTDIVVTSGPAGARGGSAVH